MSTEEGPAVAGEEYERQRTAYEEQLDRIPTAEMVLQAAVSLLTIGGRRLGFAGPPEEGSEAAGGANGRDLEQVRDAIDAVSALLPILERRMPGEIRPMREALSQLQFAYARASKADGPAVPESGGGAGEGPASGGSASGGSGGGGSAGGGEPGGAGDPSGHPAGRPRPGPAESSGRLWIPGR